MGPKRGREYIKSGSERNVQVIVCFPALVDLPTQKVLRYILTTTPVTSGLVFPFLPWLTQPLVFHFGFRLPLILSLSPTSIHCLNTTGQK